MKIAFWKIDRQLLTSAVKILSMLDAEVSTSTARRGKILCPNSRKHALTCKADCKPERRRGIADEDALQIPGEEVYWSTQENGYDALVCVVH